MSLSTGGIGFNPKIKPKKELQGQAGAAYMANNTNENPLDNKHLPGGIFTYPKDC